MPRIPEETIEEIRQRADLVSVVESYVQITKRGNDFWACCPFHQEKTPSFKISPAHQAYHCFGCGAGGNVFSFVMARENVDFIGAVHLLAQRFNVVVPEAAPETGGREAQRQSGKERARRKETLFKCLREIAAWYGRTLSGKEGAAARDYLEKRGIDRATIEQFGIGFAPDSWEASMQWGQRHGFQPETMLECGLLVKRDNGADSRIYDRFRNRIVFPIHDELGRVIGFSGRTMDSDSKAAKYINTPETPLFHKGKLLYGLHLARTNFKRHGFALVCEGQLDVIACHRCGFDNAIAPQGTAFTDNQARILKRFTSAVTFAFDSDPAGLQAAAKSIATALRLELKPRVVSMPEKEDPDSVFHARGGDHLHAILENSQEAMEFLFQFACRSHDPETAHGKDAIAWFLVDILSRHPSAVLRSAYCQWLSRRIDVPDEAVFDMLNRSLRQAAKTRGRDLFSEPAPEFEAGSGIATTPVDGSRLQTATIELLDLALHHGSVAHQLTETLNREFLGHNPPAMALNLVLDETENGRHAEAGRQLAANHQLSADQRISRVLAGSKYPELPVQTDAEHRRRQTEKLLQRAVQDCLAVIEIDALDDILQKLDREIEAETDPERQREKLLEYQRMVQRSRLLRNRKDE